MSDKDMTKDLNNERNEHPAIYYRLDKLENRIEDLEEKLLDIELEDK